MEGIKCPDSSEDCLREVNKEGLTAGHARLEHVSDAT